MDSLVGACTEVNLLPKAEAIHLGLVDHNREQANYSQPIAVEGPLEGIGRLALVHLPSNSFKGIQVVRSMGYIVPSLPKAWDHHPLPSHFCL